MQQITARTTNHSNMYTLTNKLDSSVLSSHSTLISAVTALLLPTTPFGADVFNADGSDVEIDALLDAEHIVRNQMALTQSPTPSIQSPN